MLLLQGSQAQEYIRSKLLSMVPRYPGAHSGELLMQHQAQHTHHSMMLPPRPQQLQAMALHGGDMMHMAGMGQALGMGQELGVLPPRAPNLPGR